MMGYYRTCCYRTLDKTKTAEFISEWKQRAINQVQEVVDGLHNMDRLYLTHSNEELDEVERAIFDDPIRRLLHAAVGDPQEGERQNIDDYYRGGEISECIESMVVWKRIMRNAARQLEENERMERIFRRSRELWDGWSKDSEGLANFGRRCYYTGVFNFLG